MIDAHHHLWDLTVRPQAWTAGLPVLERSFEFAELRPLLAAAGVQHTVLVHCLASAAETRELLAIAGGTAEIAGVVGWLDLAAAGSATELSELRSGPGGSKLVGIRHQLQLEPDPLWFARPGVRQGLLLLADQDLAYDIVVSAHQLAMVTEVVRSLPEVRFVLDHAGKPPLAGGELADWHADITRLAALDNVAVKLSGLVTEADWASWTAADLVPVVERLLAVFGADRIMFGSDWPVCLLAASYAEVVESARQLLASVSSAEWSEIFGGTATRWYRLAC